jgi:hypothetical protein
MAWPSFVAGSWSCSKLDQLASNENSARFSAGGLGVVDPNAVKLSCGRAEDGDAWRVTVDSRPVFFPLDCFVSDSGSFDYAGVLSMASLG